MSTESSSRRTKQTELAEAFPSVVNPIKLLPADNRGIDILVKRPDFTVDLLPYRKARRISATYGAKETS